MAKHKFLKYNNCFKFLVKVPQISNLQVDDISESTARLSWDMLDTGDKFANVSYYTVKYSIFNEAMEEWVKGKKKSSNMVLSKR